jgi:hypothetical protein
VNPQKKKKKATTEPFITAAIFGVKTEKDDVG